MSGSLHAGGAESRCRQTAALRPEVHSQAEQKYVGIPCTAGKPKADATPPPAIRPPSGRKSFSGGSPEVRGFPAPSVPASSWRGSGLRLGHPLRRSVE